MQAATCSERRAGLETLLRKPIRRQSGEGRCSVGSEGHLHRRVPPGYLAVACMYREIDRNTGSLSGGGA